MKFIKSNILNFIVLVLVLVLILDRCNKPKPVAPADTLVKKDTIWIKTDSTVYLKPQLIKTIPVDVIHSENYIKYLPDTNYSKLLLQYTELANKFISMNIYEDSIKIDSIGYVHIKDTVSENMITARAFSHDLKYPVIRELWVRPAPPTRQLYFGGGVSGTSKGVVNQIDAGFLYKNKKDQIFGVKTGVNTNGELQWGIQSYWKIKLRK